MTPRDEFLKIAKLYGEDFENPLLDAAMEYAKQYKDSPETLAIINQIMLIVSEVLFFSTHSYKLFRTCGIH